MTSHYKADASKKHSEWVDKSQEDRLVIKAIALDVTWGNDQRYWTVPTDPKNPLELHQVAWLEVLYRIPIQSTRLGQGKSYKVNFEVSLKPESAFGWSGCPVYLMVKLGSKRIAWKSADLSQLTKKVEPSLIPFGPSALTFTVSEEDYRANAELSVGLYEVWKGWWKGGLKIHKVDIEDESAHHSRHRPRIRQ